MIRGLEFISYEDKRTELGLLSVDKRRIWGDCIAALQYLRGCFLGRKMGITFFTWASSNGTRGHGFNLKEGRFRLDIRKSITIRVVKQWHRLPREVVDALPLETSKVRLNRV